ncbi:hypothetical protein NDU88_002176 [Pleurodeles waltl]|uniref:Uncharacterized protein n=1 Tax=Pleurodeles waltl TaxID=8319 RepID=A0AAV7Q7Z1_PLEWA|nr:hypothetical protein NDU88_002176 [Pleurodeles waltl]
MAPTPAAGSLRRALTSLLMTGSGYRLRHVQNTAPFSWARQSSRTARICFERDGESCNHGTDGWGFRKKSVTGDCFEEEENLQLLAEGADVGSEMEVAE